MKPSGPGLLFVGRFLITVSISVLVIGLFYFLILPGSVSEGCAFLRICPFLPGCAFIGIELLVVISHDLCISAVSVVTSPFSFLILLT